MNLEDHCLIVSSESQGRRAWRIIWVLGGVSVILVLLIKLGPSPANLSVVAPIVIAAMYWQAYGIRYQVAVRSQDIFATFGEAQCPLPWAEIESISHSDQEIVLNLADGEVKRINIEPFRVGERGQLIQAILLTYEIFKAEGAMTLPTRPPKIETKRLVLRPLVRHDSEAYNALKQDPSEMANQLYDAFSPSLSQAIFEEELEHRHSHMLDWRLGLFLRDSDEFVGYLSINNHSTVIQRSAQIGIGICEHVRNRGFATEAITGLLDFLEKETSLQKVTASCFARNEGCTRALENAGMRKIGNCEKYWFRDGEWIDGFIFEKIFHRVKSNTEPSKTCV